MSEKHGIQVRFLFPAPCGCSSVVERLVANEKVVGANPITRSIIRMQSNGKTFVFEKAFTPMNNMSKLVFLHTLAKSRRYISNKNLSGPSDAPKIHCIREFHIVIESANQMTALPRLIPHSRQILHIAMILFCRIIKCGPDSIPRSFFFALRISRWH